ncbi:MAG TPA: 4'-phosphopantetheinyl transferase superfamily protein [Pseudonocardiaceae bacterium]|nr:4'-phosphopantetheinyl transferase superfamily protein [Pseudonocardiaceae bacterium]
MTVHVWLMRVDLPSAQLTGLTGVLDERERQRAAALALDDHRRRFIAAHGVARVIIGHWLSVPADRIGWRHGLHGKPELTGTPRGTQVNLSHSGDLAVLAITEHRHCGVDLQSLPDDRQAVRLARRFFPAEETRLVTSAPTPQERIRRFGLLWTRKEACLKVAGGRLMPGLRLPAAGVPTGEGSLLVRDEGGPLPGPYLVRDLPAPPGFRAAVAVAGDQPCPLVRHWFPSELDHDLDPEAFPEPDTMAVETCSTVRQAVTSA